MDFQGSPYVPKASRAPVLTDEEIGLRNSFVEEYIKDYDGTKACIRMGIHPMHVTLFRDMFLNCGYVQRMLWEVEGKPIDINYLEDCANRTMRRLVQDSLHGQNTVASLTQLAKILALQPPEDKGGGTGVSDSVMVVPAMQDVDTWSQQAAESQKQLKHEVRQ